MSVFSQIKTVLWSFIGLAPRGDRAQNHKPGNLLLLLVIAFALVLLFLGTLAFVAHTVVKA